LRIPCGSGNGFHVVDREPRCVRARVNRSARIEAVCPRSGCRLRLLQLRGFIVEMATGRHGSIRRVPGGGGGAGTSPGKSHRSANGIRGNCVIKTAPVPDHARCGPEPAGPAGRQQRARIGMRRGCGRNRRVAQIPRDGCVHDRKVMRHLGNEHRDRG